MTSVRSHYPWKMWIVAAAAITGMSVLTGFDLYGQMTNKMREVADQAISIAVGELASILSAAQELLRSTEQKLKEEGDIETLSSRPDALFAALKKVEETLHGVGFANLAALDRTGRLIAVAGDDRLEGRDFTNEPFLQAALDGEDFVLSKPIAGANSNGPIAPLVQWVKSSKDEPLFLLMTLIDVRFLQNFQSRLQSSIVHNVALLDRSGRTLVGVWPFADNNPSVVEIKRGVGAYDLIAAAGFRRSEVFANVKSELMLLSLTWLTSLLAVTALAVAYAYRSQVGEVLREIVEQKDVLHREAQHRVSGALQLISSLVSLQARETEDDRVDQALETIKHRIAAILAVNGRLSSGKDGGSVDLGSYLRAICDDLATSYEEKVPGAHLETSLSSITCDGDKAVRLGLIVNELVTNAYWHGFAQGEGGVVAVELAREGDDFSVMVSDDGIGLAAANEDAGIGLELVSLLAEQLGCTLERRPSKRGVTWQIKGSVAKLQPADQSKGASD